MHYFPLFSFLRSHVVILPSLWMSRSPQCCNKLHHFQRELHLDSEVVIFLLDHLFKYTIHNFKQIVQSTMFYLIYFELNLKSQTLSFSTLSNSRWHFTPEKMVLYHKSDIYSHVYSFQYSVKAIKLHHCILYKTLLWGHEMFRYSYTMLQFHKVCIVILQTLAQESYYGWNMFV